MNKYYYIVGTLIVLSIILNMLFDLFFKKNIKASYYASRRNKKKLLKMYNKIIIKNESKIQKQKVKREKKLKETLNSI